MHSVHSLHNRILFHHPWNPEVIEYYFYQVFSRIAYSLANIFLPVYLYAELGYSIMQIMLFYFINEVYFVLLVPFSGKVIEKIGVKHTIALYIPFLALFWYSLRFLKPGFYENLGMVVLILALKSVPRCFVETAEIAFVSKNIISGKKYGASLAKLRIALIIAALISPLLGSLITYFFGFDALFNWAIFFLLISAIPFFFTKDSHFRVDFKAGKLWDFTLHRLPKGLVYAEFGRVFADTAMWILWPLFIYVIVANVMDLGIIVTISGLVSMVIAYQIGKRVDYYESEKLLKRSVKLATGIFYFRTLFANPMLIAVGDILNRIFDPLVMVPYEKYLYKYMRSFSNIIEIANAKVLISEISYLIGTATMALAFFFFKLAGLKETNIALFIIVFAFFGLSILFMARISEVESQA